MWQEKNAFNYLMVVHRCTRDELPPWALISKRMSTLPLQNLYLCWQTCLHLLQCPSLLSQTQLGLSLPLHIHSLHISCLFSGGTWPINHLLTLQWSKCLMTLSLHPDSGKQYWFTEILTEESGYLHYVEKFRLRTCYVSKHQCGPHVQSNGLE